MPEGIKLIRQKSQHIQVLAVSGNSIRIAFTLAALTDLNVLSADVQGAYLNAPTKEKVYTIAGLEFGADKVG